METILLGVSNDNYIVIVAVVYYDKAIFNNAIIHGYGALIKDETMKAGY